MGLIYYATENNDTKASNILRQSIESNAYISGLSRKTDKAIVIHIFRVYRLSNIERHWKFATF